MAVYRLRGVYHSVDDHLFFSSFSELKVILLGPYLTLKKARIGACGCATALAFAETGQEQTVVGSRQLSRPSHESSTMSKTKRNSELLVSHLSVLCVLLCTHG